MDLAGHSREHLVRLAEVQSTQITYLLKVVASKCARLDEVTGQHSSFQTVLDEVVAQAEAKTQESSGHEGAQGEGNGSSDKKARKPRGTFGPTEQPELPQVEQTYTHDEADMTCPSCGGELEAMAGQFETSEMVEVIEVSYQIEVVKRQKYRCRCGSCVETAPGPERAIEGGRYSLGFAAKVAVDKYLDHLPLERQCRIMGRHGLQVTSQTLWDQLHSVAMTLGPVWEAIKVYILAQTVIGLDQTGWPNLSNKHRKKWQMWNLVSTDAVFYDIRDDKSAETFIDLVGAFKGTIVADQLSSHGAGARGSPGVLLAGCWAHVHRKFREATPNFPEAQVMVDLIRELYDIEESAESREHRAELRCTESKDVLGRMRAWMASVSTISSTDLGKAIKHTMSYWGHFTHFLTDPDIWLDNNRAERGFRGPVVGRRNHFGSKSRRGTHVAAVLYTLLESAKLAKVDPASYLIEAVQRARMNEVLLPWNFTPNE